MTARPRRRTANDCAPARRGRDGDRLALRAFVLVLVILLIAAPACVLGEEPDEQAIGSEPITPADPAPALSAEGILDQAQSRLREASSFEITCTTVRRRADGDTSDETRVRISGDSSSHLYSRHGSQVNEVLVAAGQRHVRGYFVGQAEVKWEDRGEADSGTVEHARSFIGDLFDITEPRLAGTRERDGQALYVLEGASPLLVTFGGIGIWAEVEPGVYTLEVGAESMAPVRLVYSYSTTIYHDGTPSAGGPSETTVTLDFAAVDGRVTIDPPAKDTVARPDDPAPTPDDRFPATPTPPSLR
jgi:hypothetical protein